MTKEWSSSSWADLLGILKQSLAKQQEGERSGDELVEEAWRELSARVHILASKLLPKRTDISPDDIEDVVQEALLKMQRGDIITRLASSNSIAGYVAVMLRNRAIDFVRSKVARRECLSNEIPEVSYEERVTVDDLRLDRLEEAVSSLNDADRAVLRMKFWDDLSIRSIAADLGVKYSTAAVRLFRAIKRLRARYEVLEGEDV